MIKFSKDEFMSLAPRELKDHYICRKCGKINNIVKVTNTKNNVIHYEIVCPDSKCSTNTAIGKELYD